MAGGAAAVGVLAGAPPALHLSACVCARVCVWGRVRTRTRVFDAIRHRVICWGRRPCGSRMLVCCATSLGMEKLVGVTSGRDSARDAGSSPKTATRPSPLREDRVQRDPGASASQTLPRPPPSSPPLPSPHFLKKKPLMSPAWQPRGGVPTHALQQAGEKSVSVPLHVKRLTIKTPYGNVKLFFFFFFGIMSALARRGMEHSIGSSEGGNKRLQLSGE